MVKHASLFSGIGGFDLAAQWIGWENIFHCEWNEFGQKVLQYYWPNAICYGDITKTDFTIWRNRVDVLSGGFPCQPYSQAGKRLGKEDARHLWPQMLRAIREIQPGYVVGENVFGLTNWNGGLVFEEVCADLEAEGYEVQPYILPAAGVGAPHKRDRVWFVAKNTLRDGCLQREPEQEKPDVREQRNAGAGGGNWVYLPEGFSSDANIFGSKSSTTVGRWKEKDKKVGSGLFIETDRPCLQQPITYSGLLGQEKRQEQTMGINELCKKQNATDSGNERLQRGAKSGSVRKSGEKRNEQFTRFFQPNWQEFPTQSPVRCGDDGVPSELVGITFPKHRSESLKAYGNAIVPQVAYEIFKVINQMLNKEE